MRNCVRQFGVGVFVVLALGLGRAGAQAGGSATWPTPQGGDYTVHNFHFQSGETLPEVRMHYRTLGQPVKDASGRTTNAVLILHGTGGDGGTFLRPIFAGVLFGPGQLLDAAKFYIIIPDNVGHGKCSKPSDGMRAHFPQYDYADMIALQHELLEKGLSVKMMDALMPLACLPVPIAGRNRLWRKMVIDGIRQDPDWKNGDYASQPRAALQISADFLLIAGGAPLHMQEELPTRDAADKFLDESSKRIATTLDANDFLYAVSASRNYDPSSRLDTIRAPVMFINSADDFINPAELGIAEQEIKKVKRGRFVLLPASQNTFGHGTHTHAAVWQQYLKELLEESGR
jgi:homoserine O-acetyltransferase/O-succinyltransferase